MQPKRAQPQQPPLPRGRRKPIRERRSPERPNRTTSVSQNNSSPHHSKPPRHLSPPNPTQLTSSECISPPRSQQTRRAGEGGSLVAEISRDLRRPNSARHGDDCACSTIDFGRGARPGAPTGSVGAFCRSLLSSVLPTKISPSWGLICPEQKMFYLRPLKLN